MSSKKRKMLRRKNKTTKASAKEFLKSVEGDFRFFSCNGEVFENLEELISGLGEINKNEFSHHSNKEKNDFADWAEYVLGDKTLSESLNNARTAKTKTLKALKSRVSELKKIIK